MDRQLLTTIAAIVCIAACIYLFREMKQAKEEVDGLKMVQTKMMHMLTPPPPQPRPFGMPVPPPPPRRPTPVETTASEPEVEEVPVASEISEEK